MFNTKYISLSLIIIIESLLTLIIIIILINKTICDKNNNKVFK